jgi:hypothetical protein
MTRAVHRHGKEEQREEKERRRELWLLWVPRMGPEERNA